MLFAPRPLYVRHLLKNETGFFDHDASSSTLGHFILSRGSFTIRDNGNHMRPDLEPRISVECAMRTFGIMTLALVFSFGGLSFLRADDDAKEKAVKKDRKLYEGTWRVVSLIVDGNEVPEDDAKKITVVNGADGSWSIQLDGNEVSKGTSTIDPTKKPKTIDLANVEGADAGKTALGIYEIDKDSRKVCYAKPDAERPTEFSSKTGSGLILVTLKREKQ
jgi:uncharacterized protein (TIGR03067 family)